MKIILFGGLCYAGKTYIADTLCDHNKKYVKTSFASALKNELHDAGIIDKKLLSDKKYKSSVRGIMQRYGQEKRAADPFYLARIVAAQIPNTPEAIVLIDDWRFKNEAKHLINAGHEVLKVYVKRSDYNKLNSVGKATLTDYYKNHHNEISEQELWCASKEWIDGAPYFDLIYYNNTDGDKKRIIANLEKFINEGRRVKNYVMQG